MIKNTIVALVAAVSMVGIAAPAFADTPFGDGSVEMREFTADGILASLKQQGINATSVEEWGGLVRAYVTLDNGSQVMQFFTPGSLNPVSL